MPTDLQPSQLTTPGRTRDIGRLADNLGFLAARFTYFAARSDKAALQPLALSIRQYTVLELATVGPGMSQRELGRMMCLDPSNVLRLVDQLSARGLVVRERDAGDRRVTIIRATDEGHALAAAAGDALERAHVELLAPLSAAERDNVARMLRQVALAPDEHIRRN